MWPCIKRWRDWAMTEFKPLQRIGSPSQALAHSYEKAGLVVDHQPIPWNAEAVVVEAALRLPPAARHKIDFSLQIPGLAPIAADTLRRDEATERFHLFFRFAPPATSTTGQILFRGKFLGQLPLPVISVHDFHQNLKLQMPTVTARIADRAVACTTFVAQQCKGLTASAVLSSPTALVAIVDQRLRVVFRADRASEPVHELPISLSSTQLAARQAILSAMLPVTPKRTGVWHIDWLAGNDTLLASIAIKSVSPLAFRKSLRLSDTRFVIEAKDGLSLRRQMPRPGEASRIGPGFLVSSGELGMAGTVPLKVVARANGSLPLSNFPEQIVFVSDGPTLFVPGLIDAAELESIATFDLMDQDQLLGCLPTSPSPTASFTGEGGFSPPPEFTWTSTADDELSERLSRLLEGPGAN